MNQELTLCSYDGKGFSSVFEYGSWKIAMIRDSEAMHTENIRVVSRHMETDEAFTLLAGEAYVYLGGNGTVPGTFVKHRLAPGKTYVVHATTWHTTVTTPGCHILVVENADTGAGNSEKFTLDTPLL